MEQNYKILYENGTTVFFENYDEANKFYNKIINKNKKCSLYKKSGGILISLYRPLWILIKSNILK